MKKWLVASIVCSVLILPMGAWGADSGLPDAVPSDLPFPAGASLDVTTSPMSGGKQYVVSFSFSGDADAVYENFKKYAASHGYEIGMETDHRFASTQGPSRKGLTVTVRDMGPVSIGTVSVLVPSN